ncbi:MAG: T9SS type A sorting domain-containing protein [Candidatus Marinimicrobia bacterium]|nr:T9SS type A sorting domain-containing protein [Candidatus Neomarinimicrobiota bacterium]
MYNIFLRNLTVFCTSVVFLFAQDVTLTLDGGNLNYESSSDIYGFQFNHDGCASSAAGGDAAAAGFMLSASGSTVIGFSLSGSSIAAGAGTLLTIDAGASIDCLSAPIFSGAAGTTLEVVFASDGPPSPVLTILSPLSGDEIIGETIDVHVLLENGVDGDHYHAFLDGNMMGMFYADNFTIPAAFGTHELTVALADDLHAIYDGVSASVGFTNSAPVSNDNSVSLSLMATDGGLDVYMNNTAPVAGFQFSVSGISLSGASGGSAVDAGFSVSTGPNGVIGFSMTGSTIGAGDGLLTSLTGEFNAVESCIGDLVLSVDAEGFLTQSTGDCVATNWDPTVWGCTDASACNYNEDATDDDGSCVSAASYCLDSDGDGLGAGDSISSCEAPEGWVTDCSDPEPDCATNDTDECGDCGGNGIDEGACDCAGNVDDCAGECGGSAANDNCGVCNGGNADMDECGECFGNGIGEGECDCNGNVEDCAGTCGGSALEDECGVCNGDGADNTCWDGEVVCSESDCSATPPNYPSWSVNAPDYQYNGSVTSIVMIDDMVSGTSADLVAAFVGDECRGVANGLVFPPLGVTQFNILAYSNAANGEFLTFKYYDSALDEAIDLAESMEFVSDMTVGNGMNPYIFTPAVSEVTTNVALATGWNWFSINAASDDMSLSNVLSSINGSSNYIKSQGAYADYYDGFGWWGTLESINNAEMYKLVATSENAIEFTGSPVDVASVNIGLSAGWNWIGYAPQSSMDIGPALSSIDGLATYIKSQGAYADYYDGFGWWGTLATLDPYAGYMLSTTAGGTLTYPSDGVLSFDQSDELDDINLTRNNDGWDVKASDFEFNGSITAQVKLENGSISEGDMLAAFADGECRGVASAISTPFGSDFVFPVMVYGNEEGASMTFEYFDSNSGQVIKLAERIEFTSDMALGNAIETVVFSAESVVTGMASRFELGAAYPNPFNPTTTFEYSIDVGGDINISILDMNGRVVEVLYSGFSDAGHKSINWDASYNPSGVYFAKLISGNKVETQKIVLVK